MLEPELEPPGQPELEPEPEPPLAAFVLASVSRQKLKTKTWICPNRPRLVSTLADP